MAQAQKGKYNAFNFSKLWVVVGAVSVLGSWYQHRLEQDTHEQK